jgi:hypothetical protein
MYADTADYAEWKTGRRATGLIFSASIFAQKQGWGGSGGFTLLLMGFLGFVANQVQTPRSLHGLVELMSIFPAALGVIVPPPPHLPVSAQRKADVGDRADLKVRRAADAAFPAPA